MLWCLHFADKGVTETEEDFGVIITFKLGSYLKERINLNSYTYTKMLCVVDFIHFIENNCLHRRQESHVPSSVFPNPE